MPQVDTDEEKEVAVVEIENDNVSHNSVGALMRSSFSDVDNRNRCFSMQPSWWLVRIILVLLAINIFLLAATYSDKAKQPIMSNDNDGADALSWNGTVESSRTSAMLNNATIPQWKPLPVSTQVITKIAFGSCSSQEMPLPYWDTITMSQPDLFVLMGDNVYGDCDDPSCFKLREAYRKFSLHPSVQGGAMALSVFATLDDHDYGQSDSYVTNPYKDLAKQLFQEFFDVPTLPTDGVYRSAIWGKEGTRLQVILLDTRYGRDPFVDTGIPNSPYKPVSKDKPQQQMLSEQQWSWLDEQLREPADLRLLISSVQVLNPITGFEAWRHLPAERERLYDLIKGKRVVILSGDRHFGGFYESDALVEVTASSFTHTIPLGTYDNCTTAADCDEADSAIVGDAVRVNHFGWIDIDWQAATVTVAFRRTESTYGSTYTEKFAKLGGKFSDAGEVLVSRQYSLSSL